MMIPPIPLSYHLKDALILLKLDRASFSKSGLGAHIRRYHSSGHAHYDALDVREWADRLARRRALIRLGRLHRTAPLMEAPAYDEYDLDCPVCGGLAVWLPPQTDEEWSAWAALHEDETSDYPAACSNCDWSSAGQKEA